MKPLVEFIPARLPLAHLVFGLDLGLLGLLVVFVQSLQLRGDLLEIVLELLQTRLIGLHDR